MKRGIMALILPLVVITTIILTSSGTVAEAQQQQMQLQNSTITGTMSPTAQQIIDSVHSECAKVTPSVLAELCLFLLYESDTTIVLKGQLLIVQEGGGYIDNPFIWQAVDEFKAQGYSVNSVMLGGQGSQANPHEVFVVMTR